MIQDVSPGVRKSALHGLNNTLLTVKNLKPSDANTFPEYIFPGLVNVSIQFICNFVHLFGLSYYFRWPWMMQLL